MTPEENETAAAAAVGAAAAVTAVTDQQHQDEAVEVAATSAVMAESIAEDARDNAEQAAEAAAASIPVAVEAAETSHQAAEQAEVALSETAQLRQEFTGLRSEVTQGFDGIRNYFESLNTRKNDNDIHTVEVEAHGDQTEQSRANAGSESAPGNAGGDDSGPRKRHRFGR